MDEHQRFTSRSDGLKRSYGTTFMDFGSDRFYNPDFVKMAESFGARGIKVDDPHILGDAIKEAVKSEKPTVVEVSITNEHPKSGGTYLGFADFPVPWYVKDRGKRGALEPDRSSFERTTNIKDGSPRPTIP